MDINYEYYKIFYYVAKYRNITKAATAMGSNQPNVTRIMKLLESQLNCRLFVREARGVSLTPEGERLYSHVEIAYRHLWNAQEELFSREGPGCGTIEIGTTETALYLFLLEALHGFKKKYPAIRIKIHNHTTPETVRHLASGRLDLALITTPFEAQGTVLCETVSDFQEILAGGLQYEQLCKTPLKLKDIRKYPLIGLGRGSATYEFYRNFFIEHKIDVEPDMEVATSGLMLPLIEHNLGIGFVPEKLALPFLGEKKLVHIHIDCAVPQRSIQIASDQGRERSLAAETFYQYLKTISEKRTTDAGL